MNCKNCKYCKQYISKLTQAYGGWTYLCDIKNCVVGHYDLINKKDHWREYQVITNKCTNFEQNKSKQIVFTKRKTKSKTNVS